jgi:hypothetical protein
MGIDVYWKNESGEILSTVEDPDILSGISDLLYRHSGSCLRFVDPAGDACFNQLQLPSLLTELRQLQVTISDTRAEEHVQQIVRLVENAAQVHTYVWFVVTSHAPNNSFKPKPLRGSA